MVPFMGVSINGGTPSSSILVGISIINIYKPSIFGVPLHFWGNPHILLDERHFDHGYSWFVHDHIHPVRAKSVGASPGILSPFILKTPYMIPIDCGNSLLNHGFWGVFSIGGMGFLALFPVNVHMLKCVRRLHAPTWPQSSYQIYETTWNDGNAHPRIHVFQTLGTRRSWEFRSSHVCLERSIYIHIQIYTYKHNMSFDISKKQHQEITFTTSFSEVALWLLYMGLSGNRVLQKKGPVFRHSHNQQRRHGKPQPEGFANI